MKALGAKKNPAMRLPEKDTDLDFISVSFSKLLRYLISRYGFVSHKGQHIFDWFPKQYNVSYWEHEKEKRKHLAGQDHA